MSSFPHRRLATVVSAALLSLMLVGVGGAAASTPTWRMTVVPLPETVRAGADAGYLVTVFNDGTNPSNIPTLFLKSSLTADTTFVGTPSQGTCSAAGDPLSCAFGTLAAGANAFVTVAYQTPLTGNQSTKCDGTTGESWTFNFLASTVGDPTSDTKNRSRGDTLKGPACTNLSSDPDFGGGFASDTTSVSNDVIGGTNLQQTSVKPPKSGIVATVEDGLADNTFSCGTQTECGNRFGQWSRVNVANGHNFSSDTPRAFKVTLVLAGSLVPGGATTSNIDVIHVLNDGTQYTISTRCDTTTPIPGNVECLTVTKSGNVFTIVVWLFQNGGLHGTF